MKKKVQHKRGINDKIIIDTWRRDDSEIVKVVQREHEKRPRYIKDPTVFQKKRDREKSVHPRSRPYANIRATRLNQRLNRADTHHTGQKKESCDTKFGEDLVVKNTKTSAKSIQDNILNEDSLSNISHQVQVHTGNDHEGGEAPNNHGQHFSTVLTETQLNNNNIQEVKDRKIEIDEKEKTYTQSKKECEILNFNEKEPDAIFSNCEEQTDFNSYVRRNQQAGLTANRDSSTSTNSNQSCNSCNSTDSDSGASNASFQTAFSEFLGQSQTEDTLQSFNDEDINNIESSQSDTEDYEISSREINALNDSETGLNHKSENVEDNQLVTNDDNRDSSGSTDDSINTVSNQCLGLESQDAVVKSNVQFNAVTSVESVDMKTITSQTNISFNNSNIHLVINQCN
ncbi:unnamed protein product [Mytilus coruscus]|uniref:Uncharacterized protein n=1 Tax=Mytilus coruscus TaxID=42192 RepID=A0A6J8CV00_MYTCO|nr:unnamed protein product [Mytilus coruscus]